MKRLYINSGLHFFLLSIVLLLASCSTTSENVSLIKLGAPNTSDYGGKGNCAMTSMDAPGQGLRAMGSGLRAMGSGLRAMGSVGGLFITESGDSFVGSSNPSDVASYVSNLGSSGLIPFSPKDSVGIIVLDKFSNDDTAPTYSLGHDLINLIDAAASSPQDLKDQFESLRLSGQISHGALVLAHMHAILEAMPGVSFEAMLDESSFVYKLGKGHQLVIKAVDVTGLTTEQMINPLQNAIGFLADNGVSNYATNMSFTLVPCDVLLEENWSNNYTLEDYLLELEDEGIDADAFLVDVSSDFVNGSDPLLTFIANEGSGTGHYVASSGNYNHNYPMYPALADDVLSVASHDLNAPKNSLVTNSDYFSNSGEVAAPGWLFGIYDPISGVEIPEISYAGTSFASPATAIYTAFDLAQGAPECHAGEESDLIHSGKYFNWELDYAIDKRCGSTYFK